MTLPVSGAISINAINVELGVAGTTTASLGQASFRTLAGVASGPISMSNFYGKSNRKTLSYVFSANTANASLNIAAISGYVAGVSDVTVTVNSGVWLYATSTANAGLTLTGGTTGDTLTLINNGNIIGMGGQGMGTVGSNYNYIAATAGGTALSLGFNISITNNSYIAGGGGGGAAGTMFYGGVGACASSGGGGAGGGASGNIGATPAAYQNTPYVAGASGGGLGGSGSNGTVVPNSLGQFSTGGGGGRILPGTGGAGGTGTTSATLVGKGGGAGGGGAASYDWYWNQTGNGGAGGSSNNVGSNGVVNPDEGYGQYTWGSAGGGGWGAVGGNSKQGPSDPVTTGAAGGKCVALNGRTVTWTVTGNRYGAIS